LMFDCCDGTTLDLDRPGGGRVFNMRETIEAQRARTQYSRYAGGGIEQRFYTSDQAVLQYYDRLLALQAAELDLAVLQREIEVARTIPPELDDDPAAMRRYIDSL
jgi:hypothetical protein